ncbi:hydrophobic surface binding protein A domain-containing protein [Trichoderma velutinum]
MQIQRNAFSSTFRFIFSIISFYHPTIQSSNLVIKMVNFTKILLLASTAAATILPRDAVTVENDINQKVGPQLTTLSNNINGYPASGLQGAFNIHDNVQSLVTITNAATADIKTAGSFSEADGTTILSDLQSLVPTFLDVLSAIGNQAPVWSHLQGGQAVILSDLQGLNSSFIAFFNALTAASPADLVPATTSVGTQVADGFNSAIAAYSG